MTFQLEGAYVALVTPFRKGAVDKDKISELTEWQIKSGITGIVACGTTGETPTLSEDEQDLVIRTIVETANNRIQVIAGTGSNDTHHVIERNKRLKDLGVDGVLVVSPYYNRPTQEGLFLHFKAVAEATDLPIIVYNIQSRTAVNIETPTLAKIAKDSPNVVGVKESSGNMDQITNAIISCGSKFSVLSGDDSYTLPLVAVGGKGIISTVANIIPRDVVDLTKASLNGDIPHAREIHQRIFPLIRAAFCETNPGPIKHMMAMAGMIEAEWRLPMCGVRDENKAKLQDIVNKHVKDKP